MMQVDGRKKGERERMVGHLLPAVPINYHLADTTHTLAALTFLLNRVKAVARLTDRVIRLGYADQR